MRPAQHFRSNFGQVTEAVEVIGNPSAALASSVQMHEDDSHARNICFVWPDGRRVFLNYAYLVAGEFEPKTDKNLIRLSFSSYSVALYGYGLEVLFTDLLWHLPRMIAAVDARYVQHENQHEPVVVEMIVEKQKD